MKGKITISRVSSSDRDDYVWISVVDEKSGEHFVEVEMGLLEFANALTGYGFVDCEFVLRGTDKVGMIRETKTELIEIGRRRVTNEVGSARARGNYAHPAEGFYDPFLLLCKVL